MFLWFVHLLPHIRARGFPLMGWWGITKRIAHINIFSQLACCFVSISDTGIPLSRQVLLPTGWGKRRLCCLFIFPTSRLQCQCSHTSMSLPAWLTWDLTVRVSRLRRLEWFSQPAFGPIVANHLTGHDSARIKKSEEAHRAAGEASPSHLDDSYPK